MIFSPDQQNERLKWCFDGTKNGAWGDEPDGDHDVVCLRAADFDGVSGHLNDGSRTIRAVDPSTFAKVSLQPGDLVIEKSGGGEKQLVGRAVLFNGSEPSVCSNFLARARPSAKANPAYLNYLLLAIYNARGTWPHIKQSTGIQNLDMASYLNTRVSIPPIGTQRRIAEFLDGKTAQIDALIEKKRVLLDRLAEKRQALIIHAVTKGLNPNAPMKDSGIDWLGEIPTHWKVLPLKRIKRFLTSGSRGWAPYYADEGDVFLRMTNVTKDGIEIDEKDVRHVCLDGANEGTRTAIQENDILITITAELGSVAIARKKHEGAYINQHLALFRCDKGLCNADFLVNYLSTNLAREQFSLNGQGGAKQGLGFEQVDGVLLGLPPLGEQVVIAGFLAKARGRFRPTEIAMSQQLEFLTEYRTALITAAVTGKIAELS